MKVIAGLAKSNGSLPADGWLKATCGLVACTPGSASGPTLGNEYGEENLYLYFSTTALAKTQEAFSQRSRQPNHRRMCEQHLNLLKPT